MVDSDNLPLLHSKAMTLINGVHQEQYTMKIPFCKKCMQVATNAQIELMWQAPRGTKVVLLGTKLVQLNSTLRPSNSDHYYVRAAWFQGEYSPILVNNYLARLKIGQHRASFLKFGVLERQIGTHTRQKTQVEA